MYQPIRYLRPNECPKCGKPTLKLVDIDVALYNVEGNGKLGDHVDGTIFYLYCDKCKIKYDAEKRGMHVAIKREPAAFIASNPFYD